MPHRVTAGFRVPQENSWVHSVLRVSRSKHVISTQRRFHPSPAGGCRVVHPQPASRIINKNNKNQDMINFAKGHPNRQLLPVKEVQEILALVSLASNQDTLADSLNYPKRDTGTPRLLKELRAFFDRHTHDDDLGDFQPSSEPPAETVQTELFMTHGVSHGLDMLCVAQTTPGDVVLVEQPTYFLAAGIFRSHGLNVQSLPMTEAGGIDLDRLECELENGTLPVPRMIYVIPTHHNPTASVMSIEDRWRLARVARRYGILVVADEVYHLLDWRDVGWEGPRPARMAVVDALLSLPNEQIQEGGGEETQGTESSFRTPSSIGCCVSVSSFTKIFAPGVRCGWVEGPAPMIQSLENLGYIQSQGGCTPLVGELMHASLSSGIGDRVLAQLNAAYRERSQTLCDILTTQDGIHLYRVPSGGYFAWVSFDGIADTSTFLEFCVERGVRFLPGERCDVTTSRNGSPELGETASSCRRYARFCFADLDSDEIVQGAKLVVECYRDYVEGSTSS